MFVLHIGLHKTATTSLQKDVFPFVAGFEFVGRRCVPLDKQNRLYCDILQYCSRDPISAPPDVDYVCRAIAQELNYCGLLFSDEWLTADYSGYFRFGGASWQEKLIRFSRLLWGVEHKVIVTLRDPVEGLYSQYCEFRTVGIGSLCPDFQSYALNSNDAQAYHYYELDKFLRAHFESVYYVLFDSIKNDPALNELCKILNVESLPSMGHHNKRSKAGSGTLVVKRNAFLQSVLGVIPESIKKRLKRSERIVNLKKILVSAMSSKEIIEKPSESLIFELEQHFSKSYIFLDELRCNKKDNNS